MDYNAEENLLKILHKMRAYGHKRIAYVEFTNLYYGYSERMHKVYREFMSLPPFNEEYLFSPGTQEEYFQSYGSEYYRQMAKDSVEWLLSFKRFPTAVIVLSDKIAEFMIEYFRRLGISVPKNISIVTYFNHQNNKLLAGLNVDSIKRAKLAAQILFDQIKYQRHSVIQEFVDGKFVDGPSFA